MPHLLLYPVIAIMLLWLDAAAAASLSGKVTDEGEPLQMAEVLLIDANTHVLQGSLFSAADGGFRFSLPEGRYHLNVVKDEYADARVQDIDVGKADVVQDIELLPAAFAEQDGAPASSSSDDCD